MLVMNIYIYIYICVYDKSFSFDIISYFFNKKIGIIMRLKTTDIISNIFPFKINYHCKLIYDVISIYPV